MLDEPQNTVSLVFSEQFPVQMYFRLSKVISVTVYTERFAFLPDPLELICYFPLSQEVTIDRFFSVCGEGEAIHLRKKGWNTLELCATKPFGW